MFRQLERFISDFLMLMGIGTLLFSAVLLIILGRIENDNDY